MTLDVSVEQSAWVADPKAREFLRRADPVLRKLIDAQPDFERWRPYRSLAVSYLFASEFEKGP